MKTVAFAALLALAFSALGTSPARAQSGADAPKTRAEVRAETAAAVRSGDVSSSFEGLKMNELLPSLYAHGAEGRAPAAARADDAAAASQLMAAPASRGSGK